MSFPSHRFDFRVRSDGLVCAWEDIGLAELLDIYSDGRVCNQQITARVKNHLCGSWPKNRDSEGFDFFDHAMRRWESKTLKDDVDFSQSISKGGARPKDFDSARFVANLSRLYGFAVADIYNFPDVSVYFVSAETILWLWSRQSRDRTVRESLNQKAVMRRKALFWLQDIGYLVGPPNREILNLIDIAEGMD